MSGKLLTEHHFEFLSLKGGCTGSSEFTLVKIPHCWKSHVAAQLCLSLYQHPYFVYESSKGSGKSVHLRRLALAFIARHCVVKLFRPRHHRGFANSKGADQLAHPRSLINAFVVRLWVNSFTFNCDECIVLNRGVWQILKN